MTPAASRTRRGERGPVRLVGDALLDLAAVGGGLCIVLVVLALVFDITLIMFKTGSMSPTIPAGSVALVQQIPAADIVPGDVITVDRPDALPVTHRVTDVTDAGGATRIITMKGDANLQEDPAPYTVDTVRRVLGSVPDLAHVIVRISDPPVMAAITVLVAGLVTWSSWPTAQRRNPSRHTSRRGRRREENAPSEDSPHGARADA
ncbi:hypothetical protein AC792_03990 [Arthrobacter sp. RIT-PI-e]|uniref:signal peptidase I n=1 Tax=Arthrobacter sp. RIT-PI-e TaxID=1681197 RepID=UPI0006A099BF|nr:signal peptidase I [Arthrobacter sp. RIT-PI-e]KNC19817.1 hypothetical protein AC792_03990 [Arthrobacter sp. RIT-PI-e]